jgi:hypothetical protein
MPGHGQAGAARLGISNVASNHRAVLKAVVRLALRAHAVGLVARYAAALASPTHKEAPHIAKRDEHAKRLRSR